MSSVTQFPQFIQFVRSLTWAGLSFNQRSRPGSYLISCWSVLRSDCNWFANSRCSSFNYHADRGKQPGQSGKAKTGSVKAKHDTERRFKIKQEVMLMHCLRPPSVTLGWIRRQWNRYQVGSDPGLMSVGAAAGGRVCDLVRLMTLITSALCRLTPPSFACPPPDQWGSV